MIDKIFIINLEKRVEKKKKMISRTKNLLQFNIEIFKGIDGSNIDKSFLDRENIKIRSNWKNPYTKNVITKGEIGCALSHIKIWETIIERNYKYTLIIEDDIVFENNFVEKVKGYFNQINNLNFDFDLFYLSRKSFEPDLAKYSDNIYKPNFSYWTCGYILSFNGALKLINSKYKKDLIPVDEFLPQCYINLNNKFNVKDFNAIVGVPHLIKPENNAFNKSDTENSKPYSLNQDWTSYKGYKFQLITVATDEVDGYLRFIKSTEIYNLPCKTLGLRQKWEGLDMTKGPGGGHKVNMFKKYLKSLENINENSIIMFTDSYDVIINSNVDEIIEKFLKFKCKLLFSGEIFCWPDKGLKNKYPETNSYFKYLNSGGFIGYTKYIKRIIMNSNIENYHDDQLFYTLEFLNNNSNKDIKLDYNCEIFQTLSGLSQSILELKLNKSRIYNSLTSSNPCIIHGNGGVRSKLLLNHISNYIPLKWRPCYGYCKNIIFNRKIDYPTINIVIDIINDNLIKFLSNLNYPNDKITISLENSLNNNELLSYKNLLKYDKSNINKIFLNNKSDYILFLCKEHIITNMNIITDLILCEKDIISPLMRRKDTLWSNFWGDIDKNGFYKRSTDYIDIFNLKKKGIWNVPYIYGTILIKKNKYDVINRFLKNIPNDEDFDMFFCRILRENNIFMHICNLKNFGYIV